MSRPGLYHLTVALGVGIVVCGVASLALWLFRWQQAEPADRPEVVRTVRATHWPAADAEQAMTASRECVRRMHSIDSAGFDQDVQKALDCSTGSYRSELDASSKQLEQVLGTSTSITAEITDSAIVRFANGQGRFLFSVDTTVRSAGSEATQRHYRMIVDATLVSGRFLVSDVRLAS